MNQALLAAFFEDLAVTSDFVSNAVHKLMDGEDVLFDERPIGVELPSSVDIPIAETEPGLQGDRSSAGRKPATLVTGLVVQVPLFVGPDDVIRVDTRTGEYLTRANG